MRSTLWDDFKLYVLNSGNTLNKLLAVNIIVYILFSILWVVSVLFTVHFDLEKTIKDFFAFPSSPLTFIKQPWGIITYQFVHEGFFHLFFNLLVLLTAGRIFREFLGDEKLLSVYLLGGAAGAIMFMLAFQIFPIFSGADTLLMGASASILAILAAAGTLVPNYTLYLVLIGPVRLIYVVLFFLLIDLINLGSGNAGGHFAHLGGALYGFIYIKTLQNGNDIGAWLTSTIHWVQNLFHRNRKTNTRSHYSGSHNYEKPAPRQRPTKISQEEVDSILDKIAKSGYDSLSQYEKDVLFRASKDS
jgi:membrane associated rhomboid family serine protease